MKIDEIMARAAWSAQSDEYNDWDALGNDEREALLFIMKAAIAAIGQAGYAVVPVEPTKEMLKAGMSANVGPRISVHSYIYEAMTQQAKEDM